MGAYVVGLTIVCTHTRAHKHTHVHTYTYMHTYKHTHNINLGKTGITEKVHRFTKIPWSLHPMSIVEALRV